MRFLQRAVPILFGIMFIYILGLLFFFGNIEYINQRNYLVSNIYSLIFIFIVFISFYFYKSKKDLSNKKYFIILFLMSSFIFGIQVFIQTYGYFTQTWDAGHMVREINHFSKFGYIQDMSYMTRYPNNSMLTFILILIRSIPYVGASNYLILIINALLVNLAGIFTSLTIRNLSSNNKQALAIYIILIPLVLLSPWILVYYSDTFAILFPIVILYIYTKKERDYRDYFFLIFCALLGYYIKPTVIIILIAIVIVEIFSNIKNIFNCKNWNKRKILRNSLSCLLGFVVVFMINVSSKIYVEYRDVPNVVKFNLIHFMAMGLNEETDGIYNGRDVGDSMSHGMNQNFGKIASRLFKRDFKTHMNFFARKTLVNYNDGSFAWGQEGAFFLNVRESLNPITRFIDKIIIPDGDYYKYYLVTMEWIWLMVLFFIPSVIKFKNNKHELVIMLTIIGISLFLTMFEARARYLYCYSPIFLVAFSLGITNLKRRVKK